ncbi:MAG: hypothetical protein JJ976_12715 [Rhodothermales bacterium]|nr:hypothetical protein [Rhodothermales bacterium]
MYTILVNLKSEQEAIDLAKRLETEVAAEDVRSELFIWRPSDSPTVIDAYTFERSTAEAAHAWLTTVAEQAAQAKAA